MNIQRLSEKFNIKSEQEDFDIIHDTVEKGIYFKGTNLWILIFAIVIACVGLNVNSTAVVIGAMLISPLMGPILGVGYSLATYDFRLLRRSLTNFGFAVGSSLAASTLYFLATPLSEAHSELLARTQPNIYDVVIALVGGLAGIVALSSKQKGNVIPGVAIATALMPPLCTAGYGLATGTWNYFFGAFYLFTINTVFIAVATLMTVRFLNYPIWHGVDESTKKIANRWVSVIATVTILPSLYFSATY
ncbi:TIGR00341 family protein [Parapedobacter sp. ISTM3]|uniref:TIGR00341 family protein n=1 Tax=Parapedobacter sp. ISTM3 TaxID=2800130 RepID=UPI00190602E0|nr:TIGR00341 family protein [Parapedobacter sp. ISTM3]MBK1440253.1 TIGR00341 family protein [Parapedobacter sp. ISTM3]